MAKAARQELLDELVETAKRVYDRVEFSTGDFKGGVCTVRDESCLFLNRSYGLEANLRLVSMALVKADLEHIFVLPRVRDAIEHYSEI